MCTDVYMHSCAHTQKHVHTTHTTTTGSLTTSGYSRKPIDKLIILIDLKSKANKGHCYDCDYEHPQARVFENTVPSWWCCIGRFQNLWNSDLASRNKLLGVGLGGNICIWFLPVLSLLLFGCHGVTKWLQASLAMDQGIPAPMPFPPQWTEPSETVS